MSKAGRVYFLVRNGCDRSRAWRTTDNHIHGIRTACHEVSATTDTTQQNQVESIALWVRCMPHVGAAINLWADAKISEIALCKIRPTTFPLVCYVSDGIRCHLYVHRLVSFSHFHFLAAYGCFLAKHGSGRACIVHDGEDGILRNLLVFTLCVEILVAFKYVNAKVIHLVLQEDRMTVVISVAFVSIGQYFHGVNRVVNVGNSYYTFAKGTVLHIILLDCDGRVSAILANHLSTVFVRTHHITHWERVLLHLLVNGVSGINDR